MDLKVCRVIYIKLEHAKKIIEISMESIKDSLIDKADSKEYTTNGITFAYRKGAERNRL